MAASTRHRANAVTALACGTLLGIQPVARAAGSQPSPAVRFLIDNDGLNFWRHPARRPDAEYTSGVRMLIELGRAPVWGRLAGRAKPCASERRRVLPCLSTVITVGQEIYTSAKDRQPFIHPDWRDERPYAGWLYAGATGRVARERSVREFGVTLGVTGPQSLARNAQMKAHTILEETTRLPNGWDTQLRFEPGIVLSARQRFMLLSASVGGVRLADLSIGAGASLGNIITSADAGARLRAGINLSHPWKRARQRGPVEIVGTVGVRGRATARDIFLDGNTIRPERRVERVPFVSDRYHSFGLRLGAFVIGYGVTQRSQEYETGPRSHTFGSIVAGIGGTPDLAP